MTSFKSQPENQADIQAITDLLLECPIGEVMTYDSASSVIGRDVKIRARYLLQAAVKAAEEKTGARYACVTGVGIKRLPIEEIPAIGVMCIKRVRRAAQRGIKRLSGVRENTTPAIQQQLNAQCAQLGAIALVARNQSTKVIESRSEPNHILPIGRTLALFTKTDQESA